jgi:ribosomal protein L32
MAASVRSGLRLSISHSAARLTTARSIPASFLTQSNGNFWLRFLPVLFLPSTGITIPTLKGIWDSVLRAVPKKKTSHSKKRSRFLAGKALKDVTEVNKCSACGNPKRAHLLCPFCVRGKCPNMTSKSILLTSNTEIKDMFLGRGTKEAEAKRREARDKAMEGWVPHREKRL